MLNHIESALWAITPEAVPMVVRFLTGQTTDAERTVQPFKAPTASRSTVAVIPVRGVLTADGPSYFGSSYDGISSALEAAAGDPEVKHIVLAVDSPGGQITGLPETAATIAAVTKTKPVTALVDGTAASAAFWLASQANEVVLTPSGEVGSVGVRMMHVDMSALLEKAGYKVTELYSGDFKTEWSPFKPLSEEAKANMQSRLEATHADFINAVAAGRGARASEDAVASRFGEGRMYSAPNAKAHGLVDAIQPPRDFYKSIITARTPAPAGLSPRRARLALERLRVV